MMWQPGPRRWAACWPTPGCEPSCARAAGHGPGYLPGRRRHARRWRCTRLSPEAVLHVVFDGRTIADHFPGIGRYAYNLARALLALSAPPWLTILHDPRQPNTRFDLARLAQSPGASLVPAAAPVFGLSTQWRLPAQLRGLGGQV